MKLDLDVRPSPRPGAVFRTFLFLAVLAMLSKTAAAGEFRGVWVDAWGTGFLNESQTTQLVADARAYNFNAIIVQMRRRGDALYTPLAGNDPKCTGVSAGYDALADVIAKAHSGSPRIEVHCWVTTQVIWGSGTPPSQPGHVFNLHPEYLMKNYAGTNWIGEGYYLDPGHPDAARWNYTMATNIARNYNIDGFHWDYIRYPAQDAGYNDTAIARYNAEFGLTGKPDTTSAQFSTWRRRQVTDFMRWVNADLLGIKPNLVISAAVFGSRSDAYTYRFQDWAAWNNEGLLDVAIPMIYSSDNATFTARADDAYNNQGVRRVYPGPGAYLNTKENTVVQLNYARSKPFSGTSLYSYRVPNSGTVDRAGTFAYVRDNYQPSSVATPAFPWKTSTTKGLVKGYVKRSDNGATVYNATVTLYSAPRRTILTEAHGHYAFFEAPIGTYSITASAPGMGTVTNTVTVTAAGVLHRDLALPAVDNTAPVITDVAATDVIGNTAKISWTTDEPANSAVDYGLTTGYGNVASNATLSTSHSITLSNLNYDTVYNFRVRSRNASGLSAVSGNLSFATMPEGVYNDVIVEARLPDGSLNSNPPYAESGAWGNSTLKSGASGLTGNGSRYVTSGTPSYSFKPALPVSGGSYDVFITHGAAASLSDDLVVSVTTTGGTGLPASSGILAEPGGNTWEYLGTLKLNPGVSVPDITLAYASGTLNSAGNGRMYADAARFVFLAPVPVPAIAQQPRDTAVKKGSSATFTVTAASNPAVLSYFWRFGGVSISGATNSSYTIASAQPANEGQYSVVITNTSGSVTSAPAMLTVYVPPSIASPPADTTVAAGAEAFFEVTSGGTEPFHYQWFFKGAQIAGANGTTLSLSQAVNTDSGPYWVLVTNVAGAVTSSVATLTVTYPAAPKIEGSKILPGNVIELECTGGPGQLIVEASPDLAGWTNKAVVNAASNSFTFQEAAGSNGRLFYRIKRDPR